MKNEWIWEILKVYRYWTRQRFEDLSVSVCLSTGKCNLMSERSKGSSQVKKELNSRVNMPFFAYSVAAVLSFLLQVLQWMHAWLTGAAWTLKIDEGHLIGPCGYL